MANNQKWERRGVFVLLTLVLVASSVAGIAWIKLSANDAPGATASPVAAREVAERSVAVSVAPITVRHVQRTVGAVGSFYGFDEVTLMAEVTGQVAKVNYDVGDIVRPGDVLLEIDKTDFQLDIELTRRAIEAEVMRLGIDVPNVDITPEEGLELLRTRFDLSQLPSVLRAKQQEDNARQRLERAQQLRSANSMSREELEQRQTDYEVARNNRVQAEYDARAVVAAIKNRLVSLKIAVRKLELASIRVPHPTQRERMPKDVQYAVVARKVAEGEMLKDAPGTSTATFDLVMDGVLKLRAQVPERFVGQVRQGQKADIRVDAYPDRTFHGEVLRINPLIDRNSRTFEVEIVVENPQRDLKAGGFAKVDILTHVDTEAWTVPAEALVTYAGSTRLFVIRDGKAHAVSATTGVDGRGWAELVGSTKSELRVDDQVITSGQDKLAEGVPVHVRGAS